MPDKSNPPAAGAASENHAAAALPTAAGAAKRAGFDPASLKGGKLHGGKGPAPGKRVAAIGKSRGRG